VHKRALHLECGWRKKCREICSGRKSAWSEFLQVSNFRAGTDIGKLSQRPCSAQIPGTVQNRSATIPSTCRLLATSSKRAARCGIVDDSRTYTFRFFQTKRKSLRRHTVISRFPDIYFRICSSSIRRVLPISRHFARTRGHVVQHFRSLRSTPALARTTILLF
jgi:hypothetical protein